MTREQDGASGQETARQVELRKELFAEKKRILEEWEGTTYCLEAWVDAVADYGFGEENRILGAQAIFEHGIERIKCSIRALLGTAAHMRKHGVKRPENKLSDQIDVVTRSLPYHMASFQKEVAEYVEELNKLLDGSLSRPSCDWKKVLAWSIHVIEMDIETLHGAADDLKRTKH